MAGSEGSRRGRPTTAERARRREAVLDAALDELVENGYEGVTMLAVAQRAQSSKETLYSWFGNREGMFVALIRRNADRSVSHVQAALSGEAEPGETLVRFAAGLLRLLTGAASVALNRAAMTSPELAHVLLREGRYRVGPLVEMYLGTLRDRGVLEMGDPSAAFELLYGLVVRDSQIRVLLGERAPSRPDLEEQARQAVELFMAIHAPT